jgi:O-acetylhomoserine (thiol)-lyase
MDDQSFNSQILHTTYPRTDAYNALSMPVYNCAAFEFDSAEAMELAFLGKSTDHTYSRITNPTVQYFEKRIQTITGAMSVTALNSGMAAISNVLITLGYAGANVVTSPHLFGNTYSLMSSTLAAFGLEVRICDLSNPKEVEANIDENTCCVFLEIITNPQLEVIDLKQLSEITRRLKVPLVADTTIIPFNSFKAKDFGVDIDVVSSTKYISGGATSLGGLILDYGTYDWSNSKKLANLAKEFGPMTFTAKLRKEIHRNMGAYMSPQVAYMQTLGLETMTLRYERASGTCAALALKLSNVKGIESVNYIGLPNNQYYEVSKSQFGANPGAMFTIDLASREACFEFLNKLKLIKRATNLFDNRSLAIHPASTIYGTFSPEIRQKLHVSDKTIRFSVGLEGVDDLYQDIVQALNC